MRTRQPGDSNAAGSAPPALRMLVRALVVLAAAHLSQTAQAWPGKWTDCVSCHTTDNAATDANSMVFVAVDGTDVTATGLADVPRGATFEVDFAYTDVADQGGWIGVAPQLTLPTGWAQPQPGTSTYAPDFTGNGGPAWNAAWDAANAGGGTPGWCGDKNCTGVGFPTSAGGITGDGWTQDFSGTAWETSKAAADDVGTAGADLDGVADQMGADARVTAPTTDGSYTLWAVGIGHATTTGTKAYVARSFTIRVCAAPPCGAAPNSPPTTTLDPLPGVVTASSLTVTGTAADADGTVTGVNVRISRGDTGQYWTGSGWSATATDLPATDTGVDFSTWSYDWTSISGLDAVSVTVSAAAVDDQAAADGTPASRSTTVDVVAPQVATAVRLTALPVSGSGFTLASDWTEAAPGTPEFQYALNAAWSAWSPSDAGASNAATLAVAGPVDGDDVIDGIRSQHTDANGNGPTTTEDLTPVYVRPLVPPAPTVNGPTTSSVEVTVAAHGSEAGAVTYAVEETTTGQYVQSDGTLGATPYWGHGAGLLTVSGLAQSTTYTFRVAAANPADASPTLAENSTSAFGATASGSTSTPGNVAPTCTLDALPATIATDPRTITGTAADSDGTVTNVLVTLERLSDNQYWNGSGWQVAATELPATNTGTNFSTWSYTWTGYALDAVQVAVSARAYDGVSYGDATVAQTPTVDTVAPVVATPVRFVAPPASGGGFTLASDWSEAAPGTPEFDYNLNGAWAGYAPDGAGNAAQKAYGVTLDGNDVFQGIRSRHTDANGNGPTVTEDLTVVYVTPQTPAAPALGGATPSSLDVTITAPEALAPALTFAIRETGSGQYVQSDGTLGVGEYWGHPAGARTVTGLAEGTGYVFEVAAANPSDASPTLTEASTSVFGPTAAATTATTQAPETTLDVLPAHVTGTTLIVTGTASDPDGTVTGVYVTLQRQDDGRYWGGAGWQAGSAELAATDTGAGYDTWSYTAGGIGTLDSVTLSVSVRARDDAALYDGSPAAGTTTADNLAPRVAGAVRLQGLPVSGAPFTLLSDWTEGGPGTPEFQYQLNGAWSSWSASDAGVSNTATRTYVVALDGNDTLDAIGSRHTDAAGNGPTLTQDASAAFVRPQTPPAPSVGSPTGSSLSVTVNQAEVLTPALVYAIQETTTGQWVQGDGTLGAAEYFGHAPGTVVVHGLAATTTYDFRTAAANPSDATPTLAENSTSALGATGSGTTDVPGDTDAPCAVPDLEVAGRTPSTVTLQFTAPVEECVAGFGNPTAYMVRYAFSPIDDATWPDARVFDDAWAAVAAAGATETITVTGLPSNQRTFFQVKALDEYDLASPLAALAYAGSDEGRTHLHVGWNMAGVEGVLGASDTCALVFGVGSCWAWQSTGVGDWDGGYVDTGSSGTVDSGAGYWLSVASSTFDLTPPGDAAPTAGPVVVPLSPGMNLVANPHDHAILVADVTLERTTGAPATWTFAEAVSAGLVLPALYAYDGVNYVTETGTGLPDGLLHPRKAYWIKLDLDDGEAYQVVLPDPTP